MTQDRPTVRQRLRAALTAFRTPDTVKPALPELEVGLPPRLWAKPIYDHWHPRGRTLMGWLHVTRDTNRVVGFTADQDPCYGASVDALELERILSGQATVQPVPVSTWWHRDRGGTYGVLGHAVVQASTRPLQDGEDVVIYDGDGGRVWIRRPEEFLDGRFEPLNDRAQQVRDGKARL